MKILLIEDNKGDQFLMQEAFQEVSIEAELSIVNDGIEAVEYLRREGLFPEASRPDLVILDLNLPRKNGREVLAEMKNDPKLAHIPVLILSNSNSPTDICDCYGLHANAYIGKPSGFQGFIDLVQMLKVFWGGLVHYCGRTHESDHLLNEDFYGISQK